MTPIALEVVALILVSITKLYALTHLSLFLDHPPISTTLLMDYFFPQIAHSMDIHTCPHVDIGTIYFAFIAISSALTFCEFGK